ncbi:MAG TPA: energy transducer TonB [Bryobacteraceae bacterium]|nr:energy transducer TonB [Bryobacteraceae bacterium]
MKRRRALDRVLLGCGMLVALGASVSAQTLVQVAQPHRWGYLAVSVGWRVVNDAEAGQLEQQLRDDPENAQVRADLLNYYWRHDMREQRVDSICWLIEHHPESPTLGLDFAWIYPDQNNGADFERVRALWLSALNPIRIQPEAFHNAARFFESSDLDRAVELAKRLETIDPAGHTKPVAHFYGLVLSGRIGPPHRLDRLTTSLPLFEELAHSADTNLVGSVADELVSYGAAAALQKQNTDLSYVCVAAFQLIGHGRQLDPQNSQWTDLLEGAQRLPCDPAPPPQVTRQINPAPASHQNPQPIQVSSDYAAMHLIRPVPPDTSAVLGLSGVVRCLVRISAAGQVTDVQPISGGPLLAPPAIAAIKQYLYSPTLVNGTAVEVETTVDVPFPAN